MSDKALAVEGKYHFCIVSSDGGPPTWTSSDDLDSLLKSAYAHLNSVREGWAYFIIDGKRCLISNPQQVFSIRLPSGEIKTISAPGGPVFQNDGLFVSLRPCAPTID